MTRPTYTPPLPPSLTIPELTNNPRLTKLSKKNKKKLVVTPSQILTILSKLHRTKAAGNELDSLDIFVKLAASHSRA